MIQHRQLWRLWNHISVKIYLPLLLIWRQSPITPQISYLVISSTMHSFTSKVLRSFNTESSHLNLGFPFFLLPSGWEKFYLPASSILAVCRNHFTLAVLITFTVPGCLYKLRTSSLYFILHTPMPQLGPWIFLKISLSDILSFPSSVFVTVQLSHPYSTIRLISVLCIFTFCIFP